MTKNIILITALIICVGILIPSVSRAEIIKKQDANITNFYNNKDRTYQIMEANRATDEEKQKILTDALANPQNYEPIYYAALSGSYLKTDKDKAAFLYMLGWLRSAQDVSMCKDTTARALVSVIPMISYETAEYISTLDKEKYKKLKKDVVHWDKTHNERYNPQWACYHGLESFSNEDVELLPMKNYTKMQNKIRKMFIGAK